MKTIHPIKDMLKGIKLLQTNEPLDVTNYPNRIINNAHTFN